MKKTLFLVLAIFSIIWVLSSIIIISEPYYINQVRYNTNMFRLSDWSKYPNPNDPEITKHGDFRWEMLIQKSNSFVFSLKEIEKAPIQISVLKGNIWYRLFYQNMSFNSVFSYPQHIYLDSLTWAWLNNEFNCIVLANNFSELRKNEPCRYISTNIGVLWFPEAYPELYLEISAYGTTWATIKIQPQRF